MNLGKAFLSFGDTCR